MSLWSYDAVIIPAVLAGFLLAGLYGDVVIGAVIDGVLKSVEASATLVAAGSRRLRRRRPQTARVVEPSAAGNLSATDMSGV